MALAENFWIFFFLLGVAFAQEMAAKKGNIVLALPQIGGDGWR